MLKPQLTGKFIFKQKTFNVISGMIQKMSCLQKVRITFIPLLRKDIFGT